MREAANFVVVFAKDLVHSSLVFPFVKGILSLRQRHCPPMKVGDSGAVLA